MRAFGLRQTRYRGLAKTALQHAATAAAINLDRLTLHAEHAEWRAALPNSLHDSSTAGVLETIIVLNLTTLADIEMPRGYDRD